MTTYRLVPSGWQRIVLIVLRILFGMIFIGAGAAKLLGVTRMVQEFGLFAPYGLGQWFRYLTGTLEIVGAVLMIPLRTVTAGAALLICVSLGALVAQAVVLHQDLIHAIVFTLLLGWIAYAYRGALRSA